MRGQPIVFALPVPKQYAVNCMTDGLKYLMGDRQVLAMYSVQPSL